MNIFVLDSGVNDKLDVFAKHRIKKYQIKNNTIINGGIDTYGHGTAVMSILTNVFPQANYTSIKIFNNEKGCTEHDLISALQYIEANCQADIINISAGTTICESNDLYNVCKKLSLKGTIIIGGFDNRGAVSYPAAYDCVIGVDASADCKKNEDFIYIENSFVNVFAKGVPQNVIWCTGKSELVDGSSFAVPYVTAYLASKNNHDLFLSLRELRNKAVRTITLPSKSKNLCLSNTIKKAIAFPFNKEIHALCRFSSQLNFELCSIYNSKYLGNVGKNVSKILFNMPSSDLIISDIDKINWHDDFDTFILGHCDGIINLLGREFINKLIEQCIMNKKNLFAFDDKYITNAVKLKFEKNGLSVTFPVANEKDVLYKLNKMYISNCPLISVVGTSSQQGKLSVQMYLRKFFNSYGYSVGQIGTEPNSLLLGFDCVVPIGFNSTLNFSNTSNVISYINECIHEIEAKKVDLILAGGQSNILPRYMDNLSNISFCAYEYLLGVNADITILCVNIDDDINHIKRCINFIEGINGGKVLALVVFPLRNRKTWSSVYDTSDIYSDAKINKYCKYLENELSRLVVKNNEDNCKKVVDKCISYLL